MAHTPQTKRKFFLLLKQGLNQKQASKEIGITEKTGGKWAKEHNDISNDLYDSAKMIASALKEKTASGNFSAQEIKTLTEALKDLEQSQFIKFN